MLDIKEYGRREFSVQAVQVTDENMNEVADWCGAPILSKPVKGKDTKYIDVPTHRPLNERQKQAFVTDWILLSATGYKVYTDKAFRSSFTLKEGTRNVFEQQTALEQDVEEETSKIEISQEKPEEPSTREALGLSDPKQVFFRSAETGRIVSEQFAKDNPTTTTREEN